MMSLAHCSSKALLLAVLPLLGMGSTFAQQDDHTQQVLGQMAAKLAAMPLQGIKDCGILVENLNEEAIKGGLNERKLQSEVSAKLGAIGVRTENVNASSNPNIYVNVLVSTISNAGYFFSVTLELHEQVSPVRDKAVVFSGTTWHRLAQSTADRNSLPLKVAGALSALLDEFRKDYFLVNSQ